MRLHELTPGAGSAYHQASAGSGRYGNVGRPHSLAVGNRVGLRQSLAHGDVDAFPLPEPRAADREGGPGRATGTVQLLNAYFDCLVGSVEEHGGFVLKFIGDAILAFFPLLSGTTEPKPIEAILAIRKRLEELNQARSGSGEPALGHALCAHFGQALYGNVGSSERLDFTIIGESVNMAARGVSAAKLLGTDYVFTRSFINRFKRCRFVPIGRHTFKGIAEPQELFTFPAEAAGTVEPIRSRRSSCEPLLTEAELQALLGDDIATIAPEENTPVQQDRTEDPGDSP